MWGSKNNIATTKVTYAWQKNKYKAPYLFIYKQRVVFVALLRCATCAFCVLITKIL